MCFDNSSLDALRRNCRSPSARTLRYLERPAVVAAVRRDGVVGARELPLPRRRCAAQRFAA